MFLPRGPGRGTFEDVRRRVALGLALAAVLVAAVAFWLASHSLWWEEAYGIRCGGDLRLANGFTSRISTNWDHWRLWFEQWPGKPFSKRPRLHFAIESRRQVRPLTPRFDEVVFGQYNPGEIVVVLKCADANGIVAPWELRVSRSLPERAKVQLGRNVQEAVFEDEENRAARCLELMAAARLLRDDATRGRKAALAFLPTPESGLFSAEEIVAALSELGPAATPGIPALARFFDEHPALRAQAALALGRTGSKEAADVLRQRLATEDGFAVAAGLAVMGSTADGAVPDLVARLGATKPWGDCYAAALAYIATPRANEALRGLLLSSDPDIARSALQGLSSAGTAARRFMKEARERYEGEPGPDDWVRNTALAALVSIVPEDGEIVGRGARFVAATPRLMYSVVGGAFERHSGVLRPTLTRLASSGETETADAAKRVIEWLDESERQP